MRDQKDSWTKLENSPLFTEKGINLFENYICKWVQFDNGWALLYLAKDKMSKSGWIKDEIQEVVRKEISCRSTAWLQNFVLVSLWTSMYVHEGWVRISLGHPLALDKAGGSSRHDAHCTVHVRSTYTCMQQYDIVWKHTCWWAFLGFHLDSHLHEVRVKNPRRLIKMQLQRPAYTRAVMHSGL